MQGKYPAPEDKRNNADDRLVEHGRNISNEGKQMSNLTEPSEVDRTDTRSAGPIYTQDEPRASSNAGMNAALILTAVLSALLIIWGVIAYNHVQLLNTPQPHVQNPSTMSTPDKQRLQEGDASHVGGQAVQGDAIVDGPLLKK